jgi:polysaccharide biosynthesis transport protein
VVKARHFRSSLRGRPSWPRFLVANAIWIIAVTLAAVAGAAALAHSQTPQYRSQAVVIVSPPAVSASSGNPPNMATEEDLVKSGTVLTRASALLHVPVAVLASGLSVNVPSTTTLLQISYSDPVPRIAQERAQGIALAYVSYRSARPAQGTTSASHAAVSANPSADLVTSAQLPTSPASPDYLIDIGGALIVGLALGIGFALLRDRLDDHVRGPLDLEAQAAAPVLGLIPAFRRSPGDRAGQLVMAAHPESAVAEAYRCLRTQLLQTAARLEATTILVTSPGWEDKSAVAVNLAAALAQSGRDVALVCADLRWGRAHEPFGPGTEHGLSGLLEGRTSLAGALQPTEVPGLRLLAPGLIPADPAALLQRPGLRTTLGEIRRRVDIVVIEAPPLLASPDARPLADLADMILLVADARRSSRTHVRLAMHEAENVRGKLAGWVLGNVGRRRRLGRGGRELAADGCAPAGAQPGEGRDQLPGGPEVEQLEHDLARAIAERAETCVAGGRHREAVADFTRAIDLDPNLAWAIHSRGQAYAAMGCEEEAKADFRRAADLRQDFAVMPVSTHQQR